MQECEDCGVENVELKPFTWNEQEYPGAHVWSWTCHLCESCHNKRCGVPAKPVLENKRGW